MNINLYNREKYIKIVSPLRSGEDRNRCHQLLTSQENATLCHGIYNSKFINAAIEQSDYVIIRHIKGNIEKVVAFALLQIVRSKIMDILLVCTVPNSERFGNMIAYDIFAFTILKKCKKMITEPRTTLLRTTFIKYGFQHLHGVENENEVLERKVEPLTIQKTNKTRKTIRRQTTKHSNSNDGSYLQEL